jgi:hypothetical protein
MIRETLLDRMSGLSPSDMVGVIIKAAPSREIEAALRTMGYSSSKSIDVIMGHNRASINEVRKYLAGNGYCPLDAISSEERLGTLYASLSVANIRKLEEEKPACILFMEYES